MGDGDWLAERFEADRGRLRAVAYRMLGSASESEDAVWEAWLRVSRADAGEVVNLGGWLTTVVGRVCLDMMRSRQLCREEPPGVHLATADVGGPEDQALLADSVGVALLVVLETLTPAERLAFVLHDMFAVPFEEIATIVGRSPAAARQLASRARCRVRETSAGPVPDPVRHRVVVEAFVAALRGGDFEGLPALLDPDVVVRADAAAAGLGAVVRVRGAAEVVKLLSGRANGARPALVDGIAGAVWAPGGRPRVVFEFRVTGGLITGIDLVGDPGRLAAAVVEFL